MIGGHDLAALSDQRAVRVEDELGIVEAATVSLVDTQDDHGPRTSGRGTYGLGHRAWDIHRLIVVSGEEIDHQNWRIERCEIGIDRNDSLGEDRQLHLLPAALLDGPHDLFGGPVAVRDHG
jgi:hypothetical protein